MKSSCENKIAMGCFFLLLIANYVLTNKLFFFLCALSLTFSFSPTHPPREPSLSLSLSSLSFAPLLALLSLPPPLMAPVLFNNG